MQLSLFRFSTEDIRKASSAMGTKNRTNGQIVLRAGGKTKTISTRVSSEEIKRAWKKVNSDRK